MFSPISIILLILSVTYAKIYERCELARELRNFDLPEVEIPTWVCIAQHESNFDTSAMNPGSGDHGLFQISQLYWCSPPGDGYGCNSPCSKFRDDDIADDLQCIRRIYNEHTKISGDGFNAWVVYPLYCKNDNSPYVQGCFDQELPIPPDIPFNATENEIPNEENGDGYEFPPLPNFSKNFPRTEQRNSTDQFDVGDGYEFPKLPFSRILIQDSVPVKENTYDFPTFPSSKQSIHEFTIVHKSQEETISGKTDVIRKFENNLPDEPANDNIYNFPIFPASKQSIHEFRTVHKPIDETVSSQIDRTEQDENILAVKSVKENKYNFPTFPSSKQSIHEFISVNKPQEGTEYNKSYQTEQDESKYPMSTVYDQHKEHLMKIDKNEAAYNFPPLPNISDHPLEQPPVYNPSKEIFASINEATKQQVLNDYTTSPVYTKQSILHFIPVPREDKDHLTDINKETDKEYSEYIFPLLTKDSTKSFEDSKHILSYETSSTREDLMNLDSSSKFSKPSKSFIEFKPTTKSDTIELNPAMGSTSESNSKIIKLKASTTRKPSSNAFSSEQITESYQKMLPITQKLYTSGLKQLNVSTKYFSNKKESDSFTSKLFTSTQSTSTTKSAASPTTPKPSSRLQLFTSTATVATIMSKRLTVLASSDLDSIIYSKSTVSNPRQLESQSIKDNSITKPFTVFRSPTTTLKPFSTSEHFTTTTLKPFTTPNKLIQHPQITDKAVIPFKSFLIKTAKHFTTQQTSFGESVSHTTEVTPFSKSNFYTTSKRFTKTTLKPFTTHKASFQYFNPQTTTHKLPSIFKSFMTTTSKPSTTRTSFAHVSHTTKARPGFNSYPTTTSKSFTRTSLKPFTDQKVSFQYLNPQTTTHKLPPTITSFMTTTSRRQNTSFGHIVSHTTDSRPFSKSNPYTTTTSKPFTKTTFKPFITQKPSFHFFNSQATTHKLLPITFKSFMTTTSIPFTAQNTSRLTSNTTRDKPLLTFKPITTTPTTLTTQKILLKSLGSQITTIFKPITPVKSFTTQKIHFLPFAQSITTTSKPLTSPPKLHQTSTTKNAFLSRLVTTVTPLPNFTYNTTPSKQRYMSSTTSHPLAKQVTFAPDSFFSWIFGSQTLPPLVPPGRPPRPGRPPGSRPGGQPSPSSPSNQRPGPPRPGGLPLPINQRPRPGGLPRPPRPQRPGRIRTSMVLDDSLEPENFSSDRSEFERPSTSSFGERPASSSRPSSFGVVYTTSNSLVSPNEKLGGRIPSTTTLLASSTTRSPKTVPSKEDVSLQLQRVTLGSNSRQFLSVTSINNSSVTKKPPNVLRRSQFKLHDDDHAVEVKLDDNFVFFRTRYGYRLFRNNKN